MTTCTPLRTSSLMASLTCGTSGASSAMPSRSDSFASSCGEVGAVLVGQAMRDLGDVLVPEVAGRLRDDAVDHVEEAAPRGRQHEGEAVVGRGARAAAHRAAPPPSACIASRTRSTVAGFTPGRLFSTRSTVAVLTPAASAIWVMVTGHAIE